MLCRGRDGVDAYCSACTIGGEVYEQNESLQDCLTERGAKLTASSDAVMRLKADTHRVTLAPRERLQPAFSAVVGLTTRPRINEREALRNQCNT